MILIDMQLLKKIFVFLDFDTFKFVVFKCQIFIENNDWDLQKTMLVRIEKVDKTVNFEMGGNSSKYKAYWSIY